MTPHYSGQDWHCMPVAVAVTLVVRVVTKPRRLRCVRRVTSARSQTHASPDPHRSTHIATTTEPIPSTQHIAHQHSGTTYEPLINYA